MNNVNKTLYIPLYGKAYVSKRGLFLKDETAEQIWEKEGFSLKGKAKSKWLAFYMGIRSAVFDNWVKEKLSKEDDAVVLSVGCGLDSRVNRIGTENRKWYDVDFAEVIEERRKYFTESEYYRMNCGDLRLPLWLAEIPEGESAVVILEGVSMYVSEEKIKNFLFAVCNHFAKVSLIVDAYTPFAAKMSKIKNPVRNVGVGRVYGLRSAEALEGEGLKFTRELDMTPSEYCDQLCGMEKFIFKKLYASGFSKKLYKLYEYCKM